MKEENKDIPKLQWNQTLCTGTQDCISRCSFNALSFKNGSLHIDQDLCRLCGACIKVCENKALSLPKRKPRKTDSTNGGIWVFIEEREGKISSVSLELLGKAVELSSVLKQPVEAVLIGFNVQSFSNDLIAYGADKVHLIENPIYQQYIEEHYVEVMAALARERKPEIILIGATLQGRGISARLAATLKTGLTADCTSLSISDKDSLLLQRRPAFGGNLMATIKTPIHRPQMASVRSGVMSAITPDYDRKGEIINYDFSDFPYDDRIQTISQKKIEDSTSSLENCKVIIAVGRGVKKSLLPEINNIANKLGAVVAGSRAAVEAGLINASMQIGQTGHTVSPDLYIALGISGQIQHVAAIESSKAIIAVNRDEHAPIFNYADYGWRGSVEEFLPLLENVVRTLDFTTTKD